MANLGTKYAGLDLKNPIIASSSGVTDSVARVQKLAEAGVGAVVLKSIFEEEILLEMEQIMQNMTARTFIASETMDFMDEEPHEDLTRKYLSLISDCKAKVDIPIIASINAISNQKWTYLATEIEKAGADAIELNLFALPSDMEKTSQEIESTYVEIVKEVISQVNIPVTVKVSHYFTAMGNVLKQFAEAGVKGIVLFNRYYSADIDIENEVFESSAFVLSNNNEIALPMRWIGLMSDKIDVDLVATTGIHSGKDVVKLLLAGAPAVEIASVLYRKDFSVVKEMTDFVANWMSERDYETIEDFKGKLAHRGNTSSWERIQFMKEFRHFLNKHMARK